MLINNRVTTYVPIVRQVPAFGAEKSSPSGAVMSTFDPPVASSNDGVVRGDDLNTSQVSVSGEERSSPSSAVMSTSDPPVAFGNDEVVRDASVDASQDNMELDVFTSDDLGSIGNTPELPIPVIEPSCLPVNLHPMVTHAKVGVFKPKALAVEITEFEPRMIEEAFAKDEWRVAAQAECDALLRNQTWELVSLRPGRKAIGCKWLFNIKCNPDETLARQKGRLVAKGCSQVLGCDFQETFSPMVKPTTIWTILSIAVSKKWSLRQVDVNNVFLNGDLSEEVYMQQPLGYVQYGTEGRPLVCRLTKALYRLRQALRA